MREGWYSFSRVVVTDLLNHHVVAVVGGMVDFLSDGLLRVRNSGIVDHVECWRYLMGFLEVVVCEILEFPELDVRCGFG